VRRPARTARAVDHLSRAGADDSVDHHRGAGDDEQADGGWGGVKGGLAEGITHRGTMADYACHWQGVTTFGTRWHLLIICRLRS
jgi:hypothetical protein